MTPTVSAYGLPLAPTTPPVRRLVIIAFGVIFSFVFVFTVWGVFAPLGKAAIAPGELVVEGRRRVIQNLEGGIVAELAVAENEFVKAGQLLVRLDDTQTDALVAASQMEQAALIMEDARLEAERQELDDLVVPTTIAAALDRPRIADIVQTHRDLFQARIQTLYSQRTVFEERIREGEAQVAGHESQLRSEQKRLTILREEQRSVQDLVDLQYERRTRLLALNRELATSEGEVGNLKASIARAQQTIAQAKAELASVQSSWLDQIVTRQQEVRDRLRLLEEQLRGQDDRNSRRNIYAPVDGQVVNLAHRSAGAVVKAGEPIMEIVPEADQLIVTAYLRPQDVENVTPGLSTTTHLIPYSGRRVPRLSGSITSVARDSLVHPQTGESYYLMTVHIDDHEILSRYDVELISGMPAEVFVDLGKRSLLGYLFSPIKDSFYRSFRED